MLWEFYLVWGQFPQVTAMRRKGWECGAGLEQLASMHLAQGSIPGASRREGRGGENEISVKSAKVKIPN